MPKHAIEDWVLNRFLYLLISLLLLVTLSPIIEQISHRRLLEEGLFSAILISGIWAASRDRRHTVISIILAIPMLCAIWLDYLSPGPLKMLLAKGFSALFLAYTMTRILAFIFKVREVTHDVIYAAVIVYLLIGVLWGLFYSVMEASYPGSFNTGRPELDYSIRWTYFSFVTLTTLGFGDITPLSPMAKSMVMLEAVIGQMYIAILIARLVSMYTARTMGNPDR